MDCRSLEIPRLTSRLPKREHSGGFDKTPAIKIAVEPKNVIENPNMPYLPCLASQVSGQVSKVDGETRKRAAADLRARIEAFPKLTFNGLHFTARPPGIGWESGAVSGVAVDRKGRIYEITVATKPAWSSC
jgi:hypothetical protein